MGGREDPPGPANNDINELMIDLHFTCLFARPFLHIHRFLSNPDITADPVAESPGPLSRQAWVGACEAAVSLGSVPPVPIST